MELFNSTFVSIPFMQIFLLLVISTALLLFEKVKLALLTNYLFTFYWGFGIEFGNVDVLNIKTIAWFNFSYLGFGLIIAIFVPLYFFAQKHNKGKLSDVIDSSILTLNYTLAKA